MLLLRLGCSADAANPGGRTPLFAACVGGHLGCAALLVRLGAAVDAADHWGATPLIAASAAGHVRCVQLCLEQGANAGYSGPHGSALDMARDADHPQVVELLLQHLAAPK